MMANGFKKYSMINVLCILSILVSCCVGFRVKATENGVLDGVEVNTENGEADATRYLLTDINISVEIPDGYNVLTRESDTDNPWMALNGLTQADVLSMLEENNIYLLVWDNENDDFEVNISCIPIAVQTDINKSSEEELLSQMELTEQTFRINGYEVIDMEQYQSEETKFIMSYIKADVDGIAIYVQQYATWYGKHNMSITLRSAVDEITSFESEFLQQIVDSVHFIEKQEKDYKLNESLNITYKISYVIGTMIAGVLMGLIPLITAVIRKRLKSGFIAIGVCAVTALINPVLSLLSAMIAMVAIIVCSRKKHDSENHDPD